MADLLGAVPRLADIQILYERHEDLLKHKKDCSPTITGKEGFVQRPLRGAALRSDLHLL